MIIRYLNAPDILNFISKNKIMMKLIPALVAVADVARSLSVGAEVSADPKLDYANDPNYFNYDRYHQPDYN